MIRGGETKGWFVVAVFALSTLVSGALLLPGSAYLRLTPDGFEMRSLYRHLRVRWADVTWFRAKEKQAPFRRWWTETGLRECAATE